MEIFIRYTNGVILWKWSLLHKSVNQLHTLLILVIILSTAPLQLLLCHQDNHFFPQCQETGHLFHTLAIFCYACFLICTFLPFKPHSFLLLPSPLGKPSPRLFICCNNKKITNHHISGIKSMPIAFLVSPFKCQYFMWSC